MRDGVECWLMGEEGKDTSRLGRAAEIDVDSSQKVGCLICLCCTCTHLHLHLQTGQAGRQAGKAGVHSLTNPR